MQDLASRNELPETLYRSSTISFQAALELLDAGHLSGLPAQSANGPCIVNPSITLSGRLFLNAQRKEQHPPRQGVGEAQAFELCALSRQPSVFDTAPETGSTDVLDGMVLAKKRQSQMSRSLNTAVMVVSSLLPLSCVTQRSVSGLVIHDVTVVSPERTAPLEHASVRIVDGRIAEVSGRRLRGEEEIDGAGRYLIPGLIDSHVHLAVAPMGFPAGMTAEQGTAHPDLVAAALAQEPRSYLFFGFTTLVDLIGTAERTARWNALPVRPDAYFCGTAVLYQGNTYRTDAPGFSYQPSAPKQYTMEEAVAGIAADGAICVKTLRQESETTPVEQGRALVAAAHKAGLPLLIHANAKAPQAYALAIGADVIVHGMWNGHTGTALQDDAREILAGIVRDHIGYQPTMQVLMGELELFHEDYLARPELADVYPSALIEWYAREQNAATTFAGRIRGGKSDPDLDASYERTIGLVSQATAFLAQADAHLLFGSDTPSWTTYANPAGLNGRLEMNHWIAAGVSNEKLFRALTIDNARMFHLDREIGTIEPGKRANLLLLDANPLASVTAYDTIRTVFLRGRPIARETLSASNVSEVQRQTVPPVRE